MLPSSYRAETSYAHQASNGVNNGTSNGHHRNNKTTALGETGGSHDEQETSVMTPRELKKLNQDAQSLMSHGGQTNDSHPTAQYMPGSNHG